MPDIKAFNIRVPKDLWAFLKKQSVIQEKPMNVIIVAWLEKMRKKTENKLTNRDTAV